MWYDNAHKGWKVYMILEQLLSDHTPRLGMPVVKDKFIKAVAKIKRVIKAQIKQLERNIVHTARKQYLLTTAMRDLRVGVKLNEDVFIAAAVTLLVLAYGCAAITAQLLIAVLGSMFEMSESTGLDMGLLSLVIGLTLAALGALVAAFALNFVSIAVMDGVNRKKYRSIRSTIRRSLSHAHRVANSWWLLVIVHFFRLSAVLMLALIYAHLIVDYFKLPDIILGTLGLIGTVWFVKGLLDYCLVPFVALFESNLLLTETFARSRQLMKRQGQFFVISLSMLLTLIIFIIYKATEMVAAITGNNSDILFLVGLLIAVTAANCSMVMLYRKRKLARLR